MPLKNRLPHLRNRDRRRAGLPNLGFHTAALIAGVIVLLHGGQTASAQSLADDLKANSSSSSAKQQDANQELLAELEAEELTPQQQAAAAFAPPPDAKRISKTSNVWVDPQQKRVYVDGYVTLREGLLEMFACPVGTKEHESVVAALAESKEVHAALLAVGAKPGTPAMWDPKFVPPTGQRIRVWVLYRDEAGKYHAIDARNWIRNTETGKSLQDNWVFGGSSVWEDPADGRKYYQADGGDMICVSNFSTAMMDVPFASSAQSGSLQFAPFTERIPKRWTPVRLVLIPIPDPTDDPQDKVDVDFKNPPKEAVLPPGEKASESDVASPKDLLKSPEAAEPVTEDKEETGSDEAGSK